MRGDALELGDDHPQYCARFGTSNLPISSAAITYANSLVIAAT